MNLHNILSFKLQSDNNNYIVNFIMYDVYVYIYNSAIIEVLWQHGGNMLEVVSLRILK